MKMYPDAVLLYISGFSYCVKLIKDFHHVLLQLHADLFALRRKTEEKENKTISSALQLPPSAHSPGDRSVSDLTFITCPGINQY